VIGANLMEMVYDFGDKVLEHEHDAVTFFEHDLFKVKNFLLLFLFFLILAFEKFQIGLFPDLIFAHFLNVLTGSDEVVFLRVDELFFCGDLIFHVIVFVVDEFNF
jgi:hypothetical protein